MLSPATNSNNKMFGFGGFGNAPPAAASSPHSSSEFNFGGSGGTLNSSSATLAAAQSNVRLKVQAKVQDYLINVLEDQLTKEYLSQNTSLQDQVNCLKNPGMFEIQMRTLVRKIAANNIGNGWCMVPSPNSGSNGSGDFNSFNSSPNGFVMVPSPNSPSPGRFNFGKGAANQGFGS